MHVTLQFNQNRKIKRHCGGGWGEGERGGVRRGEWREEIAFQNEGEVETAFFMQFVFFSVPLIFLTELVYLQPQHLLTVKEVKKVLLT